jgi:hypothetical protein
MTGDSPATPGCRPRTRRQARARPSTLARLRGHSRASAHSDLGRSGGYSCCNLARQRGNVDSAIAVQPRLP